jgi:hypothetical protein
MAAEIGVPRIMVADQDAERHGKVLNIGRKNAAPPRAEQRGSPSGRLSCGGIATQLLDY